MGKSIVFAVIMSLGLIMSANIIADAIPKNKDDEKGRYRLFQGKIIETAVDEKGTSTEEVNTVFRIDTETGDVYRYNYTADLKNTPNKIYAGFSKAEDI